MESDKRLSRELGIWENRLASGHGKPSVFALPGRVFPPLFVWLVSQGGDDLAGGFGRASAIYAERARYRIEMLLYAALPVLVLVLGVVIMAELLPVARVMVLMLDALGSVD
jgi:type II secretory pathway component PulF